MLRSSGRPKTTQSRHKAQNTKHVAVSRQRTHQKTTPHTTSKRTHMYEHPRRTSRYGNKLNNPHIFPRHMEGTDFIHDPLANKVCFFFSGLLHYAL